MSKLKHVELVDSTTCYVCGSAKLPVEREKTVANLSVSHFAH